MNFAVPQTKFKRKNDRILKYKLCCKEGSRMPEVF